MGCKSLIKTALTTPTTVLAGGTVPLGAIIRRYGRAIQVNGNGLTLCEPAYYSGNVSITVLPTDATAITATLLVDGVPDPGSTATETPVSAGAAVNLSFPILDIKRCNSGASTITVVLDNAGTVNNMIVVLGKN